MTNWQAGGERYLSFIKGRGQDKVSDYFKAFLGCDNSVAAATETNTLLNGLEYFSSQQSMDDVAKDAFLNRAFDICNRLANEDEPLDIQIFSNELWPNAPEELVEVLSNPDLQLNKRLIIFNEEDETLTITNLPEDLKDRLHKEYQQDDGDE